MLDVARSGRDFPILERTVRDGKPLVYLDSGATSQKPVPVIDAEQEFYDRHNAAVHRGAHQLAEEATDVYEGARATVAAFIGAGAPTRWSSPRTPPRRSTWSPTRWQRGDAGAGGASGSRLGPGDEIVVTEMEHHANLVPWQELCRADRRHPALVRGHRRLPARPVRPRRRDHRRGPRWSR